MKLCETPPLCNIQSPMLISAVSFCVIFSICHFSILMKIFVWVDITTSFLQSTRFLFLYIVVLTLLCYRKSVYFAFFSLSYSYSQSLFIQIFFFIYNCCVIKIMIFLYQFTCFC